MDEKDVIDVEVVEAEVEIIDDGQVSTDEEEVSTFTDQEIDEKVKFLKDSLKDNQFEVNDTILRLAKEIARNSKDFLDNDTFLWVMYTYALHYRATGNKNAERYCFIRIKNILDVEKGKGRKPKALTFVANTLTPEIKAEVEEKTAFMNDIVASIKKQFIMMEAAVLFVFVIVLMFLLRYDLLTTLLFTVAVGAFNVVFTYRKLKNKFFINQTNTSKSYCKDEELLQFDYPVSIS